jgi:hypothetical protein
MLRKDQTTHHPSAHIHEIWNSLTILLSTDLRACHCLSPSCHPPQAPRKGTLSTHRAETHASDISILSAFTASLATPNTALRLKQQASEIIDQFTGLQSTSIRRTGILKKLWSLIRTSRRDERVTKIRWCTRIRILQPKEMRFLIMRTKT